jgi:hypothetical protein
VVVAIRSVCGSAVVAAAVGAAVAVAVVAAGAEAFAVRKRATPCWFTTLAAGVGTGVGAGAGAWLAHPAKQAARNSITNIVEINPTCTSLLMITPGYESIRTFFNVSFCSLSTKTN